MNVQKIYKGIYAIDKEVFTTQGESDITVVKVTYKFIPTTMDENLVGYIYDKLVENAPNDVEVGIDGDDLIFRVTSKTTRHAVDKNDLAIAVHVATSKCNRKAFKVVKLATKAAVEKLKYEVNEMTSYVNKLDELIDVETKFINK